MQVAVNPSLAPWQALTINSGIQHFAMLGGVATGKTFTGSHFIIDRVIRFPGHSGFIGANTYDQLSQATLRDLFFWLEEYGIPYVYDRRPPRSWKAKPLKSYKNTVCIKVHDQASVIFTRVMSKPDNLRGMEFSFYWLDETRDTPRYGHDMVLARLREHIDHAEGIITSTTNAEDWAYDRFFVKGDGRKYGSCHVETFESVKAGIISNDYYETLLASYSYEMALQELFARHVNVHGKRAYYSQGDHNIAYAAPWGDERPNPLRELVIGCDFNYSPAPCSWVVGQRGPMFASSYEGLLWHDHFHCFDEIVEDQASTVEMTMRLIQRYPGFHFSVYGDASGNRGTNSNSGETDYLQMQNIFEQNNCSYSFNTDNCNPRVKDRVETVNMLMLNGLGQSRFTFNPNSCPELYSDFKVVGWKQADTGYGRAILSNAGDLNRTHCSDALGYAIEKMFGLKQDGVRIIDGVQSHHLSSLGSMR